MGTFAFKKKEKNVTLMAVEQDLKIMILSQKGKKMEAVGRKNELPFFFLPNSQS